MSAEGSQGDWTVLALGGLPVVAVVCGDAATGLGRRRDEVVGIVAGLVGARLQLLALHLLGDTMKRRRARLTQQELKQLGVQPGLVATRYPAGKDRVQVRRLTTEPPSRAPFLPLASNKGSSNNCLNMREET
jgi:hypothetical protein